MRTRRSANKYVLSKRRTNERTNEQTNKWTDRRTDGWTQLRAKEAPTRLERAESDRVCSFGARKQASQSQPASQPASQLAIARGGTGGGGGGVVVVVAAAAFLWPLYNGTRRVASLGMRDTLVPSSATLWPVASAVASSLRAALSDCSRIWLIRRRRRRRRRRHLLQTNAADLSTLLSTPLHHSTSFSTRNSHPASSAIATAYLAVSSSSAFCKDDERMSAAAFIAGKRNRSSFTSQPCRGKAVAFAYPVARFTRRRGEQRGWLRGTGNRVLHNPRRSDRRFRVKVNAVHPRPSPISLPRSPRRYAALLVFDFRLSRPPSHVSHARTGQFAGCRGLSPGPAAGRTRIKSPIAAAAAAYTTCSLVWPTW
ncbi:hypothetical protein V9T40_007467 [Parthenolecanium corni]|uniref:Uncharacterized protein n=1 Tax=Parthenolecanium corni TaxID=536013 RepID=A0AAN9TVD8_9HEMI